MTRDEVLALLKQGRGQEIDLLPERVARKKLAETMLAMANASGGTILLGVTDGEVEGIKEAAAALDKVLRAAFLCTPPLIIPLPEVVTAKGGDVLVITIPPGLPHVYSLRGKYLARVDARSVSIPARQLRQLLMERGDVGFDAQPARGATQDDLNEDKVKRYAAALGKAIGDSPDEVLMKRGCLTSDGRPTNAGILLFGKEPERFFRNALVSVVRYPGRAMTEPFVREDICDTLPEQIRSAEAFVLSNIRKGMRLRGLASEAQSEYPPAAVREAVVNAVAHRDYSIRGDEIRVSVFTDRIEVYSPGRLPGHVRVDNIVEERFSRNEVIVQVLADMGFIERLGYGIDRMIRLMKEHGLRTPLFAETANGFRVALRGPGEKFIATEVDSHRWAQLGLNERQIAALDYLTAHQRITNCEYQKLYPDVSAETVRRDLSDLVEKDVLLKIVDKRATYYIFK